MTVDVQALPGNPADASAAGGLKDRLRRLGVYIIATGTAAEVAGKVVGSVENLYHTVAEFLPAGWFVNIHRTLVVIVGGGLMVGYVIAACWVYLHLRGTSRRNRLGFSALAVVLLCAMAWGNYRILPDPPDANKYVSQERGEWVARVVSRDPANGGVPVSSLDNEAPTQVWTTAQVLTGVLMPDVRIPADHVTRIRRAFAYIEAARLAGDQGWGYFEDWPFGVTEINGWVTLAEIASLHHPELWSNPADRDAMLSHVVRDVATLDRARQPDGGWSPVMIDGSQLSRTYSTVIALWALLDATANRDVAARLATREDAAMQSGVAWMMSNFHQEPGAGGAAHVGWVANPFRKTQQEYFLGLNAQALYVLSQIRQSPAFRVGDDGTYAAAVDVFLSQPHFGDADIARNDRLHDNDRYIRNRAATGAAATAGAAAPVCTCPVTIEGSTFLWYPWSVAAASQLAGDATLTPQQRERAAAVERLLLNRLPEAHSFVQKEMNYVSAEFLLGVRPD